MRLHETVSSREAMHGAGDVVLQAHPHGKVLVAPGLSLVVLTPLTAFLVASVPDTAPAAWLRWGVAVLGTLAVLRWCVWPSLARSRTSYVVTQECVVLREGVVSPRERDLSLSRLDDARVEQQGLLDRLLGCGTLVLVTVDDDEPLVLRAVPRVTRVQGEVLLLAEDAADRSSAEDGLGGDDDEGDIPPDTVEEPRRSWW